MGPTRSNGGTGGTGGTRRVLVAMAAIAASIVGIVIAAPPASAYDVGPGSVVIASPPTAAPVGTSVAVSSFCVERFGPLPGNHVNPNATSVYVAIGRPGEVLRAAALLPVPPATGENAQPWSGALPVPIGTTPGTYLLAAYCLDANFQIVGDPIYPVDYTLLPATEVAMTATTSNALAEWTRPPTITVSVTGAYGPAVGVVTFDAGDDVGPARDLVLDANGVASTVFDAPPGNHTIWLTFDGDANYGPRTLHFEQNLRLAETVTTVSTPSTELNEGETIELDVSVRYVRPPADASRPLGRAMIWSHTQPIDDVILDGNGNGHVSIANPERGLHQVYVHYLGSERAANSSSEALYVTVGEMSVVTLVGSHTTSYVGDPVWWAVAVQHFKGASADGTVQFSVNGVNVGAPVGLQRGFAITRPNAGFPAGTYTIGAHYSGDGQFLGPNDATVTLTVLPR